MSISLHPDTPEGRTLAAAATAAEASVAATKRGKIRSRLFTKYVALFVAVVAIALASNGIFEVFFYYREHKASLIRIQREQAEAAAAKISQFIKEIESQLGWTTQLPWSAASLDNRRFDALRLLRQVPAITELAQIDSTGHERLRVSRLAMDVVDSGLDLSKDPKFTEAVAHKVYYGPVYFRRESEPYMTLALAGTRKDAGVSIAEVNLKLIWDVVSNIKVGEHGHAYVVGSQGRLIAHPDISLVLRNTDMSKLVQVQAALAEQQALAEQAEQATQAAQAASGGRPAAQAAQPPPPPRAVSMDTNALQGELNIQGQEVLTAYAPIMPLRWLMFVELPEQEAYASLYAALQRLAVVLLAASIFAVLAGIFLARRMVGPIQALRAGAERIGGGDFSQHISIKTGDELEGLANQFNDMGSRLQESYADLENKVEQRTSELTESLEQQTATSEVLQVISSSQGELDPVFQTMLESATRVCGASFGTMNLWDGEKYNIVAVHNIPSAFAEYRQRAPIVPHSGSSLATVVETHRPVQVPDLRDSPGLQGGCHQCRWAGRRRGRPDHPRRADVEGRRAAGRDHNYSPGSEALHRQAGRVGRKLHQTGRDRHREHAPAQRIEGSHRGAVAFAGRSAHRAGPPGADRKAGLARPAHRRYRARDQEPAELRQQFLGALGGTDRRDERRAEGHQDRRQDARRGR